MIPLHRLRFWTAVASVCAAASLALSYFLPIWSFLLMAPQYPQGLKLLVYLDGVRGDVTEIDIINHYIGMAKLADAAQIERALSKYILGLLVLWALVWPYLALKIRMMRRWGHLVLLGFPIGFVSVFFVWLAYFGHNLDPHAIMRLPPFTPTLVGTGKIGQFLTHSRPNWGFLLMLLAAGLSFFQYKCVKRICEDSQERVPNRGNNS